MLDALSSDQEHQRSTHVDALVRIAIACDNLETARSAAARIGHTGKYRKMRQAPGNIMQSEGYAHFDPAHAGAAEARKWWTALLTILEAYWGHRHSSSAEQTKAEAKWRAASLPGQPQGQFAQAPKEQAEEFVAREGQLWTQRQHMERTDTPSTEKQRKLNLIAAATAELAKATIKRIGADDLQLMSITFDDLADYVEKADDADRDMNEITEMLGLQPNQTTVSNKKTEDLCWHHQHVGPCRSLG